MHFLRVKLGMPFPEKRNGEKEWKKNRFSSIKNSEVIEENGGEIIDTNGRSRKKEDKCHCSQLLEPGNKSIVKLLPIYLFVILFVFIVILFDKQSISALPALTFHVPQFRSTLRFTQTRLFRLWTSLDVIDFSSAEPVYSRLWGFCLFGRTVRRRRAVSRCNCTFINRVSGK